MSTDSGLQAHQILEKLEARYSERQQAQYRACFFGVLSEVNHLLNTIFWSFFSPNKRRQEFFQTVIQNLSGATEEEKKKESARKFWLAQPEKGQIMIRKPLDCLGSRQFSSGLGAYFEALPDKRELFNEHLRMRYLIFYDSTNAFLDAVEGLNTLRNHLKDPKPKNKPSNEQLYSLCYLVHPVFFSLLKGRIRTLAKGSGYEDAVNPAFEALQKKRRIAIRQERSRFFGEYRTREAKGRPTTRSWSRFEDRWQERQQQWESGYRLHTFIYQYQRINPEGIKRFADGRVPPHYLPSFEDVEDIHTLLSALDLLFWECIPFEPYVPGWAKELRNCLAHNEKVGTSENRCLRREFQEILKHLDKQAANDFYTRAESILKQYNHPIKKDTRETVRYKKGEDYLPGEELHNRKWVRRVAASIKRDLKAAREET